MKKISNICDNSLQKYSTLTKLLNACKNDNSVDKVISKRIAIGSTATVVDDGISPSVQFEKSISQHFPLGNLFKKVLSLPYMLNDIKKYTNDLLQDLRETDVLYHLSQGTMWQKNKETWR